MHREQIWDAVKRSVLTSNFMELSTWCKFMITWQWHDKWSRLHVRHMMLKMLKLCKINDMMRGKYSISYLFTHIIEMKPIIFFVFSCQLKYYLVSTFDINSIENIWWKFFYHIWCIFFQVIPLFYLLTLRLKIYPHYCTLIRSKT